MICGLKPMSVLVDYGLLRAGQLGLVGNREDVRLIEQQGPIWEEAINVSDGSATLSVRLAPSDSTRSSIPTMHEWIAGRGMRPAIFCETAAIRQAMEVAGDDCKLVCVGSLWEVSGEHYYACWHDGEVHLYPLSRPFGPDYVCPIVVGNSSSLPLEAEVGVVI